ncbi:alpha/beta hydrolase [Gordonia sp. NPDC058843]|uniref:alpha/beta hydrolase n=1 Tax=Gordonia sp. NPDC058843 TaxID=3346648 RepID=UPI00369C3D3C
MRPTISQLRRWDTAALGSAGGVAAANASILDGALDSAVRAIDGAGSWFGLTRDAANTRIDQERDHGGEVRNVLNQIADEAGDAARDLGFAKEHVLREVDSAVAGGFTVGDDGTVSHPDEDKAEEVRTIQNAINRGLSTVDELDETYGTRLEGLSGDLASMVNGQPDINVPGLGPRDPDDLVTHLRGLTPDQRASLLASLTPEQVRRLAQADPQTIGSMDGVPFPVRIDANETNIRNGLIDERQKQPPNQRRIDRLVELLQPTTDPLTGRAVERTFLGFENTPNGRMIEVVGAIGPGNPNVTVYVPGTGTNLDGSATNQRAAYNLAHATGGPVILYMDGDLPQGLYPDLTGDDDAFDTTPANQMAPGLVGFGRELDRTLAAVAPDAATTYIGHSYGGSVVGTAEQLGLNADRVIYASSAGTGVLDGPWRNPNPDVQRFSLTAPGDPVHFSQSLGGTQHGGDPDNTPGVRRLDTGLYGDGKHSGEIVWGPAGHGSYWDDPTSGAFENMVKVIRGEEPDDYVYRAPDHLPVGKKPEPPVILAPGPDFPR